MTTTQTTQAPGNDLAPVPYRVRAMNDLDGLLSAARGSLAATITAVAQAEALLDEIEASPHFTDAALAADPAPAAAILRRFGEPLLALLPAVPVAGAAPVAGSFAVSRRWEDLPLAVHLRAVADAGDFLGNDLMLLHRSRLEAERSKVAFARREERRQAEEDVERARMEASGLDQTQEYRRRFGERAR